MPVTDLAQLLRQLRPHLNVGRYVFATLAPGQALEPDEVVALVREPEGVSVVVEARRAAALGLDAGDRWAWITLTVNSDLHAVGLTAAFATALAREGLSCNVVAGAQHDHLFVPEAQAEAAMRVLQALQQPGPP